MCVIYRIKFARCGYEYTWRTIPCERAYLIGQYCYYPTTYVYVADEECGTCKQWRQAPATEAPASWVPAGWSHPARPMSFPPTQGRGARAPNRNGRARRPTTVEAAGTEYSGPNPSAMSTVRESDVPSSGPEHVATFLYGSPYTPSSEDRTMIIREPGYSPQVDVQTRRRHRSSSRARPPTAREQRARPGRNEQTHAGQGPRPEASEHRTYRHRTARREPTRQGSGSTGEGTPVEAPRREQRIRLVPLDGPSRARLADQNS